MTDRHREEATRYFSRPGFKRLFQHAKKKYESLGRIGGTVRLTSLSAAEKEALGGLLARNIDRQQSVSISLADINEQLLSTKFGVDLVTLLEWLFEEEIKPNAVRREEEGKLWESFMRLLQSIAEKTAVKDWLDAVSKGEAAGYRTLREYFERHKETIAALTKEEPKDHRPEFLKELAAVIEGLNRLPQKRVFLPVFAAAVTGDAHFFDRDRAAGRLFFQGLLYLRQTQGRHVPIDDVNEPTMDDDSYETVRELYSSAGIEWDDLSSQVLVNGVRWEQGRRKETSFAMTLRMVRHLRNERESSGAFEKEIKRWLPGVLETKKVFISENPSVCSTFIDRIASEDGAKTYPPILCTSGQPSHAAVQLFDFLTATDVHLYYSGDMDVAGLSIAQSLCRRYGKHWHPWGMTKEAVVWLEKKGSIQSSFVKGVPFSREEQTVLQNMNLSWDDRLVDVLLSRRSYKIFQEMLVDYLYEQYIRIGVRG